MRRVALSLSLQPPAESPGSWFPEHDLAPHSVTLSWQSDDLKKQHSIFIGAGKSTTRHPQTEWASPFVGHAHGTPLECQLQYQAWLLKQPHLLSKLPQLVGTTLVCDCRQAQCHGEVLAAMAVPAAGTWRRRGSQQLRKAILIYRGSRSQDGDLGRWADSTCHSAPVSTGVTGEEFPPHVSRRVHPRGRVPHA